MNRSSGAGRVVSLIFMELLLTGLVLCVFALFHHVIPRIRMEREGLPDPVGTVSYHTPAPSSPEPTSTTCTDPEDHTDDPEETGEDPFLPDQVEPTEPALLTLRERFAEHFSEEPVWGEDFYSSPNVSVKITTYDHPEKYPNLTYYVADVYIADVSCFRTGFSPRRVMDSGVNIAAENQAIFAVNSDSMLTQPDGFLVRNGEIYRTMPSYGDICVLFYDGTMQVYSPDEFTVDEILALEPYQVWQFGPSLLDENGAPHESFNTTDALRTTHPRTAIGYYEPGHYCFVVIDGRQGKYSVGADIETLAAIMSEQGCAMAFNLDGGGSTLMAFHGRMYNRQSSQRYIFDMLIIAEPLEKEDGDE